MKSVGRRSLALILSVLMTLSLISSVAFAEGDVTADAQNQEADKQVVQEVQPDAAEAPAPVAEEKTEAEAEKPAAPVEKAFSQSKIVDGVKVAVTADKGVFPADAQLSVTKVVVPAAVDTDDAEKAYAFDITILADGKKIQPDGRANVSFTAADVARYDTDVYHMAGAVAQKMGNSESGNTTSVSTTSFSTYVVTFTNPNASNPKTATFNMKPGEDEKTLTEIYTGMGTTWASSTCAYEGAAQGSRKVSSYTADENIIVVTPPSEMPCTYDQLKVALKEGAASTGTLQLTVFKKGTTEEITDETVTTTLSITATLDKYEVTFEPNGGTLESDNPQLVNADGETKAVEPDFTPPDGKTLDGWYNGDKKFNFDTPITGDITLTARYVHVHDWKVTAEGNTATIKCEAEGCDAPGPYTVTLNAEGGVATGEEYPATITGEDSLPEGISLAWNKGPNKLKITDDADSSKFWYNSHGPTEPGSYTAKTSIYVAGTEAAVATLKKQFEITDSTHTHVWSINKEQIDGTTYKWTLKCEVAGCPLEGQEFVVQIEAEDYDYHIADGEYPGAELTVEPATVEVEGETVDVEELLNIGEVKYREKGQEPGEGSSTLEIPEEPAEYYWARVSILDDSVTNNHIAYKFHLNKTPHDWTYSENDGKGTVTATCDADEACPYHETPIEFKVAATDGSEEKDEFYTDEVDSLVPTKEIKNDDEGLFGLGTPRISNDKDVYPDADVDFSEPGTYYVVAQYTDNSSTDTENAEPGLVSKEFTVSVRHAHEWTVEKEGTNVANISCTVEGCTYHDNPITVTLKAEDAVYDGAKKPATIEGEIPEDVQDEIEVFWTTGVTTRVTRGSQQWDNEDGPVDAGNYKAYTRVRVNGEKTALTKEYKITPKPVTITGLKADNKTYDGTTAATINTENAQIGGLVAGDEGKVELDAIAEGAATFADKNVGTGKAVTLDPTKVTLKGDAAKNYTVDATSIGELTADIDKAPVKVEGITAVDKAYDGTTTAELVTTGATFEGIVSGDTLTIASIGNGVFEDENVGTDKKVTIDPTSIVLGGADKDNYEVNTDTSQKETEADITALEVTVSGITAEDKVYDRTTAATLVTDAAVFEGLLEGDTLTIASSTGAGTFEDRNAAEDKKVNIDVSKLTLGGDKARNYSIKVEGSQTDTTATITPKPVTLNRGVIANNKVYDGNTDATLQVGTAWGQTPRFNQGDVISGDTLTIAIADGAKGTFNNKNVGTNKPVTFTKDAIELAGRDKDNYTLESITQANPTAAITAKDLTVSGIEAKDKVYDGNRTATLVTDNIVFNGMVEGDDLTLTFNDNAGEFDTRHVGKDKTVTIVWRRNQQNRYRLSGADVGNYNFSRQNSQQTTTASITPAKIKVTAGVGADDKVYDGNEDATLKVVQPVTFETLLNSQDIVSIEVSGTGKFQPQGDKQAKDVGEGKTVTFDPSQITLTGPQAGNYELDEEDSQSETTASITPKPIKVTGITAKDRYYDGTTDAELLTTGANIEGKIFGDEIFVESASNGKFLDKNAGNGKTVNIDPAGVVLGGTDSDNYSVNPESIQKTTTASIWKLPVEIEWYKEATDTDPAEEPIKYVYNGEKQGPVAKVKNIIEGDKVDVKVIGQEKNASADPYTAEATQLTGDDAGNYTLSSGVKQQYYIDPKPVTVVWTDKTPLVYDGTDKQPDCVVDPSQIVAGDEVEVDDVDVTKDGEKIYWDWDYMVDAATYEFEVTTLDNSNYVLKEGDPSLKHTVVVEKRVAELSWDPTEFIYNGKDRIPEATVTNLVYNREARKVDTCNVTVEGAKKDVGDDYTATATELSNKNYKLPDDPTTKFSIKPLEVVIEWSDTEFTYDGKEHMPTATVKNAVEGETLTPVVEAPQTDADTYTATVTGLEPTETAKNYKLPDPLPSTEFTIKEAELTVTAADQTISYGDDFDKTKVSYSGWVEGDDESKLDTPATVTSKYFKNSKPGTYDLVPEGASAKNYTIKTVKGKLTVNNKVTVLIAKGKVLTDSKAKLSWTKLSGAKYYKIYFNKCGKKTKYKYLKTVKRNSLNKGGLLKGQCYKFRVVAYDKNGVKIGKSRNIHFVAGKYNSKLTNAKTIKVNKKKLTLTKGQVYTVKAVQTREIGGKKLLDGNHTALFRFISSNKAVATVSKKGAIKGVGKGWCKIYVKAANGLWTTVEVTVK